MIRQGRYSLRNRHKYKGNPDNIVFRSSWERRVMVYLDENSAILEWSNEEKIIPYFDVSSNRWRRYFPDFYVKFKNKQGQIKEQIWEVKPLNQTIEPKVQKRITEQYVNKVLTWGKNTSKWKAATEYCQDRGWEFVILTEKELFRQ